MTILRSAGRLDQHALETGIECACDCGDAVVTELPKERGRAVIFESRPAGLVLVQHDAQRRVQRGRQLVLGHLRSSQRIADVVLHRLARLAGDLQQSAMIFAVEDREFRTTLQLLSGAIGFTLLQQRQNSGIEPGNRAFQRRFHHRKRLCGFDLDVLDSNDLSTNEWIRHGNPRCSDRGLDNQPTGKPSDRDHRLAPPRGLWIAAQIFCDVRGMSRCAMPNGANASSTACTIVGGAPIEPLSPIPFTPSGLVGEGVCWNCDLMPGSRSARGSA